MTPLGNFGTVNAEGLMMDCLTYAWGGSWSCLPYLAASALRLSRLGPTLPLAPAAESVWQVGHPGEVNACFPSGFLGPPGPPPPPLAFFTQAVNAAGRTT